MSYAIVDPEHVLALRSADGNRFRLPKLKDKVGMIPMEPGSLVMERKLLLGIKQRAERLASEQQVVA
jgi:hypothetical protein